MAEQSKICAVSGQTVVAVRPRKKLDLPEPVAALLRQTEGGSHALDVFRSQDVDLVLTTGDRPAYYNSKFNTCTLGQSLAPAIAASYFVHEMYHAEKWRACQSGDPDTMDRGTYVSVMVQEEIEGTVRGYHAHFEAKEKGLVPAGTPDPGRFDSFERTYKSGRDAARQANPGASADELKSAGLSKGRQALTWWVNEGGIGPAQGLTYAQYYAADFDKYWRAKNASKK